MSVKLSMSISVEKPRPGDERYTNTETRAQIDVEVPEMIGWQLYRYVVEQLTNAEFKVAEKSK